MAYFNHAFQKKFIATKASQLAVANVSVAVTDGIIAETGVHVSDIKNPLAPFSLGAGVVGLFDTKTHQSILGADISGPFYVAAASLKLNDKQGPYHGGYQMSNKSKEINPKYLRKIYKVEGNTGAQSFVEIGGTAANVAEANCDASSFLCGETYYLRLDVKGTPALRFAAHNLYKTLDASGGCCADPANPVAVDASVIYKQWATQIAEDAIMSQFIRPLLVVDGQAYAFDAQAASEEGLDPATELYSDAPIVSTTAGIILKGAYLDTKFGNCTFQCSDYFGIEPLQIEVSEVDLNGDPCTFSGVCVIERCPGIQANGSGEQKLRDVILSESYIQNFTATDQRLREITQGTEVFKHIDREAIYGGFYMLHSVPRYSNPSGTFDNDQYLIEIIGTTDTLNFLETEIGVAVTAGLTGATEIEDNSLTAETAALIAAAVIPNP